MPTLPDTPLNYRLPTLDAWPLRSYVVAFQTFEKADMGSVRNRSLNERPLARKGVHPGRRQFLPPANRRLIANLPGYRPEADAALAPTKRGSMEPVG
jgi:hypothetical protein